MLPREIKSQVICSSSTWSGAMEKVNKYYDKGMFITDFDYADGLYVLIMSKVPGWNGQVIKTGATLPSSDIQLLWHKGYFVTSVLYDGADWIVVMTGVENCSTQTWFYRDNLTEFGEKMSEILKNNYEVTAMCGKVDRVFFRGCLAIASKFQDKPYGWIDRLLGKGVLPANKQSIRYINGRLMIQDVEHLCKDGKYIVGICDCEDGAYVIATANTGWKTCKVVKHREKEGLVEKIKLYWNRDFYVTSISHYGDEWFAVLGKKD